MAIIIAPTIDNAPDSELQVHQLLRSDPATENWAICHHVGTNPNFTPGPRRRPREIDFLILIPDVGALCVEVKRGGFRVSNGQWYRGASDSPGESPVDQAREEMYQLKNELTSHFATEWRDTELPIECVVVFTDTNWPTGAREPGCPVIGLPDLQQQDAKSLAERLLEIARTARGSIVHKEPLAFDRQTVQAVVAYLFPDTTLIPMARPEPYRSAERRIARLTDEQYALLTASDASERCLFQGAAGTGKTMLALEQAKRRSANGDQIALVCYNRILGDWLVGQQLDHFKLGDLVGSFWHHFAYTIIRRSATDWDQFEVAMDNASDNDERYDKICPDYLQNVLLRLGSMFDYLVVDELQDMCQDPYLEIMDLALRGGLAGGRWTIFADFQQKFTIASWERNLDSDIDNLHSYVAKSKYTEHFLSINCRNTLPIIQDIAGISGIPMPETYLNAVRGPLPSYEFWSDDAELRTLLDRAVRGYISNGEKPSEIFVLGTQSLAKSGRDLLGHTYGGYKLFDCPGIYWPPRPYCDQIPCCQAGDDNDTYLKFREVRRFKGMESKVVILIVDQMNFPDDRVPLYVGMTRASVNLVVLGHESMRGNLTRMVNRPL